MRLILAASRSGTAYTARLLQGAGLDVGHEQIGADGAIGWQYAATKPYNQKQGVLGAVSVTLHQVRHPLKVIASMATHSPEMMAFIKDEVGCAGPDLKVRMLYWVDWNCRALVRSSWTYQVEKMPELWPEFLERLGVDYRPMPELPTTTNTRPHKPLSWGDLYDCDARVADGVRAMSESLGYQ